MNAVDGSRIRLADKPSRRDRKNRNSARRHWPRRPRLRHAFGRGFEDFFSMQGQQAPCWPSRRAFPASDRLECNQLFARSSYPPMSSMTISTCGIFNQALPQSANRKRMPSRSQHPDRYRRIEVRNANQPQRGNRDAAQSHPHCFAALRERLRSQLSRRPISPTPT